MGAQMDLFGVASTGVAARYVPATHRLSRGEETSAEAVEELASTGGLARQRQAVLDALCDAAGSTALELATAAGMDRYMVSRRLPDLREMGLVTQLEDRPCHISGRRSHTWAVSL